MKFSAALVSFTSLYSSVNSFVPLSQVPPHRFGVSLNLERGDSSNAIQEALEASRKFGSASQEARVAWDIVEEISSSDNSAAYAERSNDVLSDPSKNKDQYSRFLELKNLSELQKKHIDSVKHVTESIRAIKLAPPKSEKEIVHNPVLDQALADAKEMTEKHGVSSPEAKLAWEAVEQIASNDSSEVTKKAIDADEECLVEMVEACEALEELNRALFLESKKEEGRYQG